VALSPLKLSFGVSVLAHGVVIGGAVWLGQFHRSPATPVVGEATTLELIAAPANAPAHLVEAVVAAALPSPASQIPTPLPEGIVPAKSIEPLPTEAAMRPAPSPTAQPLTETVATPTPVTSIATVAVPTAPATTIGDNSSALPGNDFTTVAGSPTALAKPDYRKNPEPEYPLAARRRGQQGTVRLKITVSPGGRATEVSLQQSSGFDLLDQAALRAVTTWEFEPARVGAIRVASRIEVPVRFKLTN
jgi:periplasmic protein TonB